MDAANDGLGKEPRQSDLRHAGVVLVGDYADLLDNLKADPLCRTAKSRISKPGRFGQDFRECILPLRKPPASGLPKVMAPNANAETIKPLLPRRMYGIGVPA